MEKRVPRWWTLDNSAKIYPIITTRKTQSVFRVMAELNEDVEEKTLAAATERALLRYPTYKTRLRKGFFWYYLEENSLPVLVHAEDGIVLKRITDKENNRYLFRITYFNNRISMDWFHALSDGTGAMEFMKTILFEYLKLKGYPVTADGLVRTADEPAPPDEQIDSSLTYYKPKKITDINVKNITGGGAYAVDGGGLFQSGYGVIFGDVDGSELYKLAKSYNVTVGNFLVALLLYSIYRAKGNDKAKKPLLAFVPVNLRNVFPSNSMRNFTMFVRARVYMNKGENTLEDYIRTVAPQIKEQVAADKLSDMLSASVKFEKNAIIRVLPLPIKYLLLKVGKNIFLKARQTTILSNLGKLVLPESVLPYVKRVFFNLNVNKLTPVNLGVCSYNGRTILNFTRSIVDTEIERVFFSELTRLGVNVIVHSNNWEKI